MTSDPQGILITAKYEIWISDESIDNIREVREENVTWFHVYGTDGKLWSKWNAAAILGVRY